MTFNSFPANAVQDSGGGIKFDPSYPEYDRFYNRPIRSAYPAYNSNIARFIPGWDGDGDAILLPDASTTGVMGFNAAGSSLFTRTLTNLNSQAQSWAGFAFVGETLYVLQQRQNAGAFDEFTLLTIDKDNTVTYITGNNVWENPPAPTWNGNGESYNIFPTTANSYNMQYDRAADDFILMFFTGTQTQIARISRTTGLFTTGPIPIDAASGSIFHPYISPSGLIWINNGASFQSSINLGAPYLISHTTTSISSDMITISSLTTGQSNLISYYNTKTDVDVLIEVHPTNSNNRFGRKVWGRAQVDQYLMKMAESVGYNVDDFVLPEYAA